MNIEKVLKSVAEGKTNTLEIEYLVNFFRPSGHTKHLLDNEQIRALTRAAHFGYFKWPIGKKSYVYGKRVLDVGCGQGTHGLGIFALGAESYVGLDPKMKMENDKIKNHLTPKIAGGHTAKERFGFTPKQISEMFPEIRLIRGTFEKIISETDFHEFDLIVLHKVTEHLLNLEEVLRSCAKFLSPGGLLMFSHDNFYCWKGHHMTPKRPEDYDPLDPEHVKFADWNHLCFSPPPGHYFHTGLNRIRLDDLKTIIERYYNIVDWIEHQNDFGRLTPDILSRFPEYTKRELIVTNVSCTAKAKEVK